MPNLFPAIHISAIAALLASTWPVAQAATVPGQGTWEQTLQGRNLDGNLANGFEAYYDTDLDITWLKDANYIYTSGYNHSVGSTGWADATHWVIDPATMNLNFPDAPSSH